MTSSVRRARSFGIIGGLSPGAEVDLLAKLIEAIERHCEGDQFGIVFEQRPFARTKGPGAATTARMLYIFNRIESFEAQGIGTVVLPCFLSHTFMEELKENSPLPIVDMIDVLHNHVRSTFPGLRRIGVLTSGPLREQGLFERYFPQSQFEILHVRLREGLDLVTEAVYGNNGIDGGVRSDHSILLLREACADLVAQGAQLLLPGLNEIALVADKLGELPVPILDAHRVYAQHLVADPAAPVERPFKLGVVGGVGPAATVDFLSKVVRNTPASRDQDHLRVLVEQNPQIPDRTEHLVGDGMDPTLALYATCKKLQAGEADLIAIPCNTAHAFVEALQSELEIPILNMLTVTVKHIRETFPALRKVGLLATSGTVSSGVYRRALEENGLQEVLPTPKLQKCVMNAIYGPEGVKAGFTSASSVADVDAAIDDLVAQGAEIVILGCTELPLLLPEPERTTPRGNRVALVDPTDILARRCVSAAMMWVRR